MGELSPRWVEPPPVLGAGWRELAPEDVVRAGDLYQSTIQTAIAANRWTRAVDAVGLTVAAARGRWPSAVGRVLRRT